MSNHVLLAKVASEEYCCLHGYFRLCKARGETNEAMAANLNVSVWTLIYNYRQYQKKRHCCQKYSECLLPQIEEIEKSVPIPRIPNHINKK